MQEPRAEGGLAPKAQLTSAASPLSTWAPRPRTHQNRRGSGAGRPGASESREARGTPTPAPGPSGGRVCHRGTAESPRGFRPRGPHTSEFRRGERARVAGPGAASVLVKMAAPGVPWSGSRGGRRPRRGRAAQRGRTASSSSITTA